MKFHSLFPAVWLGIATTIIGSNNNGVSIIAAAAGDEKRNFLATRINTLKFAGRMLSPLKELLEAAVDSTNDKIPGNVLSESASVGDCCSVGDVGAKIRLKMSEFKLVEVDEEKQIEFETAPKDSTSKIVKVSSSGSQLRVRTGISATVGMSALLPFKCDVSSKASIIMEKYSVGFEVDMDADLNDQFGAVDIDEGEARLEIVPTLSGLCEAVKDPIIEVFEKISREMTVKFKNLFSTEMTKWIKQQISNAVQFMMPGNINLDLSLDRFLPGRRLVLTPRLDNLDTQLLETSWQASSGIVAELSKPQWRNGSSFNYDDYYPTDQEKAMPEPEFDNVINLHFGAHALNKGLATAWYLGMSAFTEDDVSDTTQCNSTLAMDSDPCPFPPMRASLSFLTASYWMLRIMYVMDFFSGFDILTDLPPPRLEFVKDGITGAGHMAMQLRGRKFGGALKDLASISGSFTVEGGLPDFDYDTGNIRVLRLEEIYVEDLKVEFTNAPVLSQLTTLFSNVAAGLVRFVSGLLLDVMNEVVERTVNELPTLLIPDMKAFPITEKIMSFYLPVGGLEAVEGSDEVASHIKIWGDLGTRNVDKKDAEDNGKSDRSVIDPASSCALAKAWAVESDNNALASFSCTYEGGAGAPRQKSYVP